MKKATIILIIFFGISVAVAAVSWFVRTGRKQQGEFPVITMANRVVEVSVGADDSAILEGIIANDAEDGDLTPKLIVEGMSRFISKGKRSATIAVVDSDDNVTEITREVIYTDYESPKFVLTSPLILPVGTSKLDGVIRATDKIDGDITGKIRMKTDASDLGDREGSYSVTFTCANSLGDSSEIPLTITYDNKVADNTYPKIKLTSYLVYVKQGTPVYPWNYVDSLTADKRTYQKTIEDDIAVLRVPGTESSDRDDILEEEDFEIQYGGLDTNVPGVYEVFFTFTDSQNRTGRTCLVIVVEEAG
ncbi:MAG: hypothetical protein J5483_07050 [Lachnospiraceae bacterium]|nr:hypothetical protein [Lachnospiraceae bacterium]